MHLSALFFVFKCILGVKTWIDKGYFKEEEYSISCGILSRKEASTDEIIIRTSLINECSGPILSTTCLESVPLLKGGPAGRVHSGTGLHLPSSRPAAAVMCGRQQRLANWSMACLLSHQWLSPWERWGEDGGGDDQGERGGSMGGFGALRLRGAHPPLLLFVQGQP